MIKKSKEATIDIIVDKKLYKKSKKLFDEIGLSFQQAIAYFLSESVKRQNLPFTPEPSDELKAALKEADDIINGKIKTKGYYNIREMIDDILNE